MVNLSCHMSMPNGEKTAYVEVAEVLQLWEKAEKYGLDFRIEDKYPLL